MRPAHVILLLASCSVTMSLLSAAAHDLPDGATVRIRSLQTGPGWHEGTVPITKECRAQVWEPDAKMPGGRPGLGLMFIEKLERRHGAKWIEMPIAPMR